MGDAGFLSLDKLFPQLAGSSYYRGIDVVMELIWIDGRPEVMPHSRCTAAAPQRMPTGCPAVPATITWSGSIVRARSIDEEAAGAAAMEAASNPTPGLSPAPAQPSGCSGRVGHKRTRQQQVLAGADAVGGASGASSAGRGGASPISTLPGAPSSHLSRVEHASYATTMMTDDDVVFDSSREHDDEDYYGDDTTLGPRDDSDQQPANDQDDSVGRSSRCVRSKQVCSGQRSGSKTNSLTTASMRERKRRDKFNRNIKLLQEIIPNTSKGDTVSVLDRAIDHLKKLQSLAQMVGTTGGNPYQPMTAQDYMAHLMLAAQVTHTTGLGKGMGINQLSQPLNIYNWPSFQYPPGVAIFGGTSINGLCNHVTK